MDKRLKEYLKDGECIRWQGSPERFELLERSYRIRVLGQWILSVLICGGIGAGARVALQESGIQLAAGVSGTVDNAVNAYLNGTLFFNNEATCDHHHGESGEGHHCGEEHHCNGHCH